MQKTLWFTILVVGVLALAFLSTRLNLDPVTVSASRADLASEEAGFTYPGPRSTPRPWVNIPLVSRNFVQPTATPHPAYP